MESKPFLTPSGVGDGIEISPKLRYADWGAFRIAYVPSYGSLISKLWPPFPNLAEWHHAMTALRRLAADMWSMSMSNCFLYLAYELIIVTSPAAALLAAYHGLRNIELSGPIIYTLALGLLWAVIGSLLRMRCYPLLKLRADMGGYLRVKYMPDLVRAHLHTPEAHHRPKLLDGVHDYGEYIPAWDAINTVLGHAARLIELVLLALVTGGILYRSENHQAVGILTALMIRLLSVIYAPTNLVGGSGYTFWTQNEIYKSLMQTHAIVFDDRYWSTVVRDGMSEHVFQEYNEKLKSLGAVQADTWILSMGLMPAWYWTILNGLCRNSAMAVFLAWYIVSGMEVTTISLVSSLALTQYMVHTSTRSLEAAIGRGQVNVCADMLQACRDIAEFYNFLDDNSHTQLERAIRSKALTKGMSLRLGNARALDNTFTLDIGAGDVVGVIIDKKQARGVIGQMICGLLPISEGTIHCDGLSLVDCDLTELRQHVAYATPRDAVYPTSLRDNVLMGLDASQRRLVTHHDLELAARLCELSSVINMYGWDYIPDGPTIIGNSVMPQPDLEAWQALNKFYPPPGVSKLTQAERFAIVLCRLHVRVKHGNARLIFLEKPEDRPVTCPALESICKLARESGKTLIIVGAEKNPPLLDNDRVRLDRIIHA